MSAMEPAAERAAFVADSEGIWLSSPERFPTDYHLSVIVPCFNEAATVAEALTQVRAALPSAQIIVVDDGSTDGSRREVDRVAAALRVEVDSLDSNHGKGAAFRAALAHAEREYTVIQDADLEYVPSDLLRLLLHAVEHHCDAVYGSRYLVHGHRAGSAFANYMAVKLIGSVYRIRFGVTLTDAATCYKLVRTELLRSLRLTSNRFELCQEITSKLLGRGVAIGELPVHYRPRSAASGKKIRFWDFFPSLFRALGVAR